MYGKTKLIGEQFIQESGCKYLIFRTAWLYSEYGNNFVKTMLRLFNEKDELNVVNDQIGTPTYAGNLAKLIVDIVECKKPLEGKTTIPLLENGIYHFTDEGVASWYDFAQCINEFYFRHSRGMCLVNGVTTKQYGSKTKIQIEKNHVDDLTYEGEICSTAHGLWDPDKLDEYKKTYAKEIKEKLSQTYHISVDEVGELTYEETEEIDA